MTTASTTSTTPRVALHTPAFYASAGAVGFVSRWVWVCCRKHKFNTFVQRNYARVGDTAGVRESENAVAKFKLKGSLCLHCCLQLPVNLCWSRSCSPQSQLLESKICFAVHYRLLSALRYTAFSSFRLTNCWKGALRWRLAMIAQVSFFCTRACFVCLRSRMFAPFTLFFYHISKIQRSDLHFVVGSGRSARLRCSVSVCDDCHSHANKRGAVKVSDSATNLATSRGSRVPHGPCAALVASSAVHFDEVCRIWENSRTRERGPSERAIECLFVCLFVKLCAFVNIFYLFILSSLLNQRVNL